jgi:serine-type D-Ala-D-Ala carboxypeptidase/endopeptidase (penicillin-binding protein 4)
MRGTTGKATGRARIGRRRSGPRSAGIGVLLRAWPTLLLTVLLAALAIPAGMLIAPALTGQAPTMAAPVQTPAWQLLPKELSVPQGIDPLSTSAPIPLPAQVAAKLNPVLKTDGGH